ncbi:tape measure domain protein [Pseudarthrobacter siccitolerans]|uniref:Tape measure domain protein n=1 Tax=Pseudarthrobacter siccitolerans TaxID=861266 RepID=A0A024GWK6_9MICC|nr:tape measure protein [Pseudarthrobacter siccitolerans]CCQ44310.1 tape measure domain protein [Pseudarthrobacter siccitolerans]
MANVGYATLTIIPSAKGFAGALGREVNPVLTSAGHESGERSGKAFGGGFLPAMRNMIGPAVGMAAGLALGQGIKSGLQTAAFMEQAQISFETLLGDGGRAQTMLSNLSAFAAKTPFELPGLVANARALLGAGAAAESVIPTMQALGDASGALGLNQEGMNSIVRAWTQMMGKGKVSAEEMLQISEAGLPIWALLSRAMGKPIGDLQKMASEGELLSSDVLPLLEAQMNKEYGGSMAKQAQTLSGVWSTVKDTLNMAMAQGLQPLVPLLTTILPPAANALAGAIGWVSDAISGLASLIFAGDFTGAFARIFNVEEDSPIVDKILTIRQAVVDFFTTMQNTGGGEVGAIFRQIVDAIRPLGEILMNTVVPALGNLGSAIVTGVQPVLRVIGDIITGSIIPAFQSMAAQAGPLFTQLGDTINVVAAQIGPILQGVADVIRNVWGFVGPFVISTVQGIFGNIVGVFQGILTVIQGVVNLVSAIFQGNWNAAWQALGQIVSGAVQAVVNFVQIWIVGRVTALIGGAMGAVRGLFSGAWDAVTGIVRGAGSAIQSTVGWLLAGMQGVVSGGLSAVRGFFSGVWSSISGIVSGAISGIGGAVSGGIGHVVAVVASLPGRAVGAISGMIGQFTTIGSQMIAGLANGIAGAAGMIRDAVARSIGNVVDFAKSLLGIHSPSRVFMEIGKFTSQGMAIGLTKGRSYIEKAQNALIPEAPRVASPNVAYGGIQGALAYAGSAGAAQPTIHQENHFNTPMSEEAYAELAARKLLRAGVGR